MHAYIFRHEGDRGVSKSNATMSLSKPSSTLANLILPFSISLSCDAGPWVWVLFVGELVCGWYPANEY